MCKHVHEYFVLHSYIEIGKSNGLSLEEDEQMRMIFSLAQHSLCFYSICPIGVELVEKGEGHQTC